MMKELQLQVMLLLIMLLAAPLVKTDDGSSGSILHMNITTYGCIGPHCLATDIVEADYLSMDEGIRGRILGTVRTQPVFKSNNPGNQVCPLSKVALYSTSCEGGPKPRCNADPRLRGTFYGCPK
ncbi:hypothetical protein PIB30_053267 [Stylosanthes scabra]|uniref:Uncharacterized protein n=1 Tax=Stylosanthes scabra TaxID=79078 RepID=A0ABU6QJ79_9FABA|nr:hypothetical protein [Stylosanthes scabra]